jgi:uncharacterized protein (DUF1697 family)
MTVLVSMLRGVNVGGHNQIKMQTLRGLYEKMGMQEPRTYVQSGNVVFRTTERDLGKLTKRLEDGIERSFGFRSEVILRTSAELREAIANNPFATRRDIHPGKLLVTFLADEPSAEARKKVLAMKTDPEELRLVGRELYIHYPNGMGRSKLSWMAVAKALGTSGTGRNWNSVTKLLEMAEALEASK